MRGIIADMNPSSQAGSARGELDPLTALRFLAAIGVVFHHVGLRPEGMPFWAKDAVSAIYEYGRFGVQFFFTLSGFILAYIYSARGSVSMKSFLAARAARILPVHFFALIVGLPMLAAEIGVHVANHGVLLGWAVSAVKAVLVILLLQAWLPNAALFWNGVSWSLSAEAFFYASFPAILKWAQRRTNAALVATFALLLVVGVVRLICSEWHPNLAWGLLPLMRVDEFIAGVIVCVLHLRGFTLGLVWGAASVALVAVCTVAPEGGTAFEVLRTLGTHVGFCLAIVALAKPRAAGTPINPWIRPFVFLGHISYAVYLLHFPLLTIWGRFLAPAHTNPLPYLAVLLALSAATYLWIEEPSRRWIRRKFGGGT